MKFKTSLILMSLLIGLSPGSSRADVTWAFWGTSASDGSILWSEVGCPPALCSSGAAAYSGGTQILYDGDLGVYSMSRTAFSFNTVALSGKTVLSARLVLYTAARTATTISSPNPQLDFIANNVSSTCVGSALTCADSSCFVSADTTINYAQWPAANDSLSITLRPQWVNVSGGATELMCKLQQEGQVCELVEDSDLNRVTWFFTDNAGTSKDPRLYVTVADDPAPGPTGTPTKCQFSGSKLQGQVNNSSPKRLSLAPGASGIRKTASGS